MRCSVVIPCHNGADLTRLCIESLLQQVEGGVDEILIVDNGSSDETPTLGTMSPVVRVLPQSRNLGFAGGVNAGIRVARGDSILVLNNDTQAATRLVAELHAALRDHPGLGAVAPVSNHVKGHAYLAVGDHGRDAAGRAELQASLAAAPPLQDVSTLAGLCLLVRRSTFDAVGLFDERFGHGNYEDDDFCLRLRLAGHRLGIAPRAFLHHEGHATFRRLGIDLGEELTRRRAQFTAKWTHDPAGRAHLASLAGDRAAAAEAALAARTAYPLWADADWHLGDWHGTSGDHERAIGHLRAFLRRCPHHAEARLSLARSELQSGSTTRAQQTLQALQHDAPTVPQQVQALRLLGEHAYHRTEPERALDAFLAAAQLHPHDRDLDNWIGLCHLARARIADAAACFERAAARGLAIANNNLGICRARQGDLQAARACFATAERLLPDDATAKANAQAVLALAH